MYKALVISENENNTFSKSINSLNINNLPKGDILIRVKYSSLNYKDALSASGNKGITRKYPHTPGIDAAGIVEKSDTLQFKVGQEVICTGYDLGMNTPGGFGQYISVPEQWVVPLPDGLSMYDAMFIGTAGMTAMNGVLEITSHLNNTASNILVTGATGGVGILGVCLLNAMGYNVIAASSKESEFELLKSLGANETINTRKTLSEVEAKPLLPQQYDGVLDTVGGEVLVNSIKRTAKYGIVATCGNVLSGNLNTSVFPFIIRGVRLIGLASAELPIEKKRTLWNEIAKYISKIKTNSILSEIKLEQLPDEIERMLKAQKIGRLIINLD